MTFATPPATASPKLYAGEPSALIKYVKISFPITKGTPNSQIRA